MDKKTTKILVVEDDESLRGILAERLAAADYQVLQAEDGQVAVSVINQHKPAVILLDLLLPKLDGYGVLEAVRKNTDKQIAQTHVIVFSNLWTDKDILRAKALKVDDYYVKANTSLDVVLGRVEEVLEGK